MVWDFVEVNPFVWRCGDFAGHVEWVARAIERCHRVGPAGSPSKRTLESVRETDLGRATDPPYYDNIGYADLSDFFYVWLRRSLGDIYPG